MRLKLTNACLAVVVLAGALARFDAISFGLPGRAFHPDEGGAAVAVSTCVAGRPVDRHYRYPPLLVNIACRIDPLLRPLTSRNPNLRPRDLLALRVVSAAAGTVTIVFLYLLALRFVAPAAALGAAFLLACFPAAIATSAYGTPDSLLVMLLVLALWLQVRMGERGDSMSYFQAALATTLAVAAKYNGAFLVFSFVTAHVAAARLQGRSLLRPVPILVSVAAVALGVAIGFPAVLFGGEGAALVSGLTTESGHLGEIGHFGFALGPRQGLFVFHFQHSILPAAGPLLLAVIAAGLIAMVAAPTLPICILLAFALPYYATIEWIYKVPPSYERYAMPLVGVYLIAAALLLDRLVTFATVDRPGLARARPLALAALFLAVGWVPLARSAAFVAAIDDDTRTRMASWMEDRDEALKLRGFLFVQWPWLNAYYPQSRSGLFWFNPVVPGRPPQSWTTYVLTSSLLYERYFEFPEQSPAWTAFYERLFSQGSLVHEEDAGAGRYMFNNPTLRLYRIESAALRDVPRARQRGANTSVGQRSPDS